MSRSILFLLLLLLFCSGCSEKKSDTTNPKTIRVVTWNLKWFPGRSEVATKQEEQTHMAEVQKALKELKPDVLLLQEVRDWQSAEELCSVISGLQVQVISRFGPRRHCDESPSGFNLVG